MSTCSSTNAPAPLCCSQTVLWCKKAPLALSENTKISPASVSGPVSCPSKSRHPRPPGGRVPSNSSPGWMNFRKFNWVSRSKIGNFLNNGGFSGWASDSSHSWDMFCHRVKSSQVKSEFPIHSWILKPLWFFLLFFPTRKTFFFI